MSNKKQGAVEWLEEIYLTTGININVHFNQAKLMEKQQIMDAWEAGNHTEMRGGKYLKALSEKYYNETYEDNN